MPTVTTVHEISYLGLLLDEIEAAESRSQKSTIETWKCVCLGRSVSLSLWNTREHVHLLCGCNQVNGLQAGKRLSSLVDVLHNWRCRYRHTQLLKQFQEESVTTCGLSLLVMPSVMMSVILQQDDNILMLSWSTINAWQQMVRQWLHTHKWLLHLHHLTN